MYVLTYTSRLIGVSILVYLFLSTRAEDYPGSPFSPCFQHTVREDSPRVMLDTGLLLIDCNVIAENRFPFPVCDILSLGNIRSLVASGSCLPRASWLLHVIQARESVFFSFFFFFFLTIAKLNYSTSP